MDGVSSLVAKLATNLHSTKAELKTARADLTRARGEVTAAREAAETKEAQVSSLEAQLAEAKALAEAASQGRVATDATLANVRREAEGLQRQLTAEKAALERERKELRAAKQRIRESSQRVENLKKLGAVLRDAANPESHVRVAQAVGNGNSASKIMKKLERGLSPDESTSAFRDTQKLAMRVRRRIDSIVNGGKKVNLSAFAELVGLSERTNALFPVLTVATCLAVRTGKEEAKVSDSLLDVLSGVNPPPPAGGGARGGGDEELGDEAPASGDEEGGSSGDDEELGDEASTSGRAARRVEEGADETVRG